MHVFSCIRHTIYTELLIICHLTYLHSLQQLHVLSIYFQERCLQLESQNAELKGALAEVSAKMEKFRKSYKDQGMCVDFCVVMWFFLGIC